MNCQLYSDWCLVKRKPVIVPKGEGLLEAAGETIEVQGVGFCGGVWTSACERDSTSVVALGYGAVGAEAFGVGKGSGSDVRQGRGYALCEGVWGGVLSSSKEVS